MGCPTVHGVRTTLQVHFQPQEAAAFRVAAACSLDNGELLTVQVMDVDCSEQRLAATTQPVGPHDQWQGLLPGR